MRYSCDMSQDIYRTIYRESRKLLFTTEARRSEATTKRIGYRPQVTGYSRKKTQQQKPNITTETRRHGGCTERTFRGKAKATAKNAGPQAIETQQQSQRQDHGGKRENSEQS